MDGLHDLGGRQGFGPVSHTPQAPAFHDDWERRANSLYALAVRAGVFNMDEYRHAIERMDPAHYLAASYYERVLTGVATLLVEKGAVGHADLEARAGAAFPLARPVAERPTAALAPRPEPRFSVGDRVAVRDIHPAGHTRVPRYVRGRRGVVLHVAPPFSFPDASAHGGALRAEHTYHVEFAAGDLWADAAEPDDAVVVDLWDAYLEPA
jgi:nitrile hydratase